MLPVHNFKEHNMAFDDDTMFFGSMGNLAVDAGEYAFSTTDDTVEVPTRLSKIISAVCTANSTSTSHAEPLFCDKTVTLGAVTVGRQLQVDTGGSAAKTSALKFNYIFVGMR